MRVCARDKTDGLAHGGADAAAFDHHIVLEPANQPDARRVLNDDEAQALIAGACAGVTATFVTAGAS